jgi:superfamily II DNA/RNA helicase
MEQADRIRELDRFKSGDINILVASDVAARGLDIKGVSHVFNYDVPWHPDDYVHRIGRTGRAGAKGKAFTLATPDDAEAVENIEKLTGAKIERVAAVKPSVRAPATTAVERQETRPASAKVRDEEPASRPVDRAPRARPEKRATRPGMPPRPAPRDDQADADDEGGWNGPLPDFLSVKLG